MSGPGPASGPGRAPAGEPGDDPLAVFRDLRERTVRDQHDLFIAESRHVVERVLVATDLDVVRVVCTAAAAERLAGGLARVPAERISVLAPDRLAALAGYDVHRGVLAAVRRPPARSPEHVLAGARLVAVLEDLTDPENLGALARSASALGVGGLLLSERCTDPLYRRTVRVSMGEVLRLPFARLAPWPDALARLRDRGWCTIGLSGDGGHRIEQLGPLAAGRPLALVLGSEADGLSSGARRGCEHLVRIPMRPGVDSLNVAAAAAIAFHQAGLAAGEVG